MTDKVEERSYTCEWEMVEGPLVELTCHGEEKCLTAFEGEGEEQQEVTLAFDVEGIDELILLLQDAKKAMIAFDAGDDMNEEEAEEEIAETPPIEKEN